MPTAPFDAPAGCTAASADEMAGREADGEAKIASELRNYEQAGPPMSCVNRRDLGGSVARPGVRNLHNCSRTDCRRPAPNG